jgi:UTP--glucose-1-phosphate uridylyltransferase
VGQEPFAVLLGDDLIDARPSCISQMLEAYQRIGEGLTDREGPRALLAIQKVPRSETHQYGIIKGRKVGDRLYRIEEMVEKPKQGTAPSSLAIIGRYILPPQIFSILERIVPDERGEIQLTDGLKELNKEIPVFGYEFVGDRYDAGDKLGYLQANIVYGLKHPEIGPRLRKYLESTFKA